MLDWCKKLIFTREKAVLNITRPAKFGGDTQYETYQKLEADFVTGKVHPMDLKSAVGEQLVEMLAPARKHLDAPKWKKLKEEIANVTVTR